jgi:DNA-binding CsgD family transcriptional regulator
MHGTGDISALIAPPDGDVIARFFIGGVGCVVVPCNEHAVGPEHYLGTLTIAGQCYDVLSAGSALPTPDPVEVLTPRELEIALLVAAGFEAKAVARRLRISFHTVRVHVGRIYAKLGLHKQTELAAQIGARFGKPCG